MRVSAGREYLITDIGSEFEHGLSPKFSVSAPGRYGPSEESAGLYMYMCMYPGDVDCTTQLYILQPVIYIQNWLSIITGTGRALDMGAYTGADESVETRTSSYAKTHETPKG